MRLFKAEDVTETIVMVMSREPQWEALPETTPPAVWTSLRRCLQRDRAKRLSDIHDAQLEIEDVIAGVAGHEPPPVIAASRTDGWSLRAAWVIAVAGVGTAVWLSTGMITVCDTLLSWFALRLA